MSEVKIYDGVTINMSTSEVISHGEITYVDNNKVSRLGGGGDKQQTTTSGVADKAYEQYVSPFLKQAQEAQQSRDDIRTATREINNIKSEMHEIKSLLLKLVDKE